MKAYAIVMVLVAVSPGVAQETQVIGTGAIECRKTLELIDSKPFKNPVGGMD